VAKLADAVADGDTARIEQLIKSGVNPNAVGDKNTSLLQWAVLNKSKRGLKVLLAAGTDPLHTDDGGDTVVHYAAKANDPEYLDILLTHHVDVNVPNALTGQRPMMSAMMGDRLEQFHKLLTAGADPSLTDHGGNTSLHVAAMINKFQLVLELLQAGGDPGVRNRQNVTFQRYLNMTPTNILTEEARDRRAQIADWLREHNVAVDETGGRGAAVQAARP
jgi:hypothetical protein